MAETIVDDRRVILYVLGTQEEDRPATEKGVDDLLWRLLARKSDVEVQALAHQVATQVAARSNEPFAEIYDRVFNYVKARAFTPEGTSPRSAMHRLATVR